jgi:hypothetical protein
MIGCSGVTAARQQAFLITTLDIETGRKGTSAVQFGSDCRWRELLLWPAAMNPQPLFRALSNPGLDDPIDCAHSRLDLVRRGGRAGRRTIERWVKSHPEPRASKSFNSGGEQHGAMMHPELGGGRRGHRIMAKERDWQACIELLVHQERQDTAFADDTNGFTGSGRTFSDLGQARGAAQVTNQSISKPVVGAAIDDVHLNSERHRKRRKQFPVG